MCVLSYSFIILAINGLRTIEMVEASRIWVRFHEKGRKSIHFVNLMTLIETLLLCLFKQVYTKASIHDLIFFSCERFLFVYSIYSTQWNNKKNVINIQIVNKESMMKGLYISFVIFDLERVESSSILFWILKIYKPFSVK